MQGESAIQALQTLLERHVGRSARVSAARIAAELGCALALVPRLVDALRLAGIAVCGDSFGGYFIAGTSDELGETCREIHATALRALLLEAQMRGAPLGELLARLSSELVAIAGARPPSSSTH